jgi:hypothetical protein
LGDKENFACWQKFVIMNTGTALLSALKSGNLCFSAVPKGAVPAGLPLFDK